MNADISRGWRRGLPHRAGILAATVGLALLTACSGSSPPGASGGSSATGDPVSSSAGRGGSSSAGSPVTQQKQLAFSRCMRSHGVPGIPTSFPGLPSGAPPGNGPHKLVQASGPNPGSPQWNAAVQACRSLLPPSIEAGPGPSG
jgi:hypothetical protein